MTAPDLSAEERAALQDGINAVRVAYDNVGWAVQLQEAAFRAGREYERKQTAATPEWDERFCRRCGHILHVGFPCPGEKLSTPAP